MKYRNFGELDYKSSVLGFGAMRLPLTSRNYADINEPESIRMIRYAIDHGVNYIDTAYPYHEGRSECVVGRALKDGYREKVQLATKMPSSFIKSPIDFDRYLNEQFERLQSNRIDFYLLHGLNRRYWSELQGLEVLNWAEGAMADGRVGHLGFSFHDDCETFNGIVDAYDNWSLCQIQYNYMDIDYQAGIRGLEYAADKGLAVVIMEPMRGGQLTKKLPERVEKLLASAHRQLTMAELSLLWVWNHPEVSVVLSGMSTMEQVIENLATADLSGPGALTGDELVLIDQLRETYRKLSPIPCTKCLYCMPCPNNVDIPRIFEIYNDAIMYNDLERTGYDYRVAFKEEQHADQCFECAECEEACPQQIPIIEWLKKAHELLGLGI
ncbi:aldo/keto reductase [Chloroflexota bacterium]